MAERRFLVISELEIYVVEIAGDESYEWIASWFEFLTWYY
jgi:hypothetical protein